MTVRCHSAIACCSALGVCLLILCLCAVPLWSQSTASGTLGGTVTDQTGAVVNGATVTLTDTSTKVARTLTSNDAGRYVFVNVDPGKYELVVSKQGFSSTKTQTTVTVGSAMTVNLALQVGGSNVVVEVTAAGNELQTMNATVGNTLTAVALDNLPSLNRDVSTFVELQPGVSPDGSVAGAVVDQSSFMLDGGNNTNDMDGSMSVYTSSFAGDPTGGISNQSNAVASGPTGVLPTPADSVEEFKVNSTGQTADFNSSAGAEVQVVTRRGTNTYHGSVYEYYLDNNWSANTWDNNLNQVKVPDWHRSRFGARFGGVMLPKILGGKTYAFGNYEGYRWPNSTTFERIVPSATMRQGELIFGGITYNLNTNANCTAANGFANNVCDPRGLGINPLVQQMWNKYMPMPNEVNGDCGLSRCDMKNGVGNIGGFRANLQIPQTSNFAVVRLDHDFSDKWHFTTSYRYFKLKIATTDQVDVGGLLPGDKLGVPSSQSKAPQLPWYYVAGLTTNISSNTTNNFHYSFLRNWWAWSRAGDVIQLPGLGGALEPLGESKLQNLSPYNVNTQQTRTRFWDGKDQMFRDDVSTLHGNHLFAFGGTYQHNFNWHQRTDNGGGINYQPVYQLGTTSSAGNGISMTGFVPTVGSAASWGRDYAATLGLVSIAQIAYTRSGSNLQLNPPLTPAFDQSTIPFYNVYFSDTWHMKPTFTLTYGMGWTLEMPPVEKNGKQVEFVDQANQLVDTVSYLRSREQAALQGQPYNPIVGFNLVGNTENGRKYPYNPYYGSFSPRVAAAWNPRFDADSVGGRLFGHQDTVIRAGYGRIFGRLNGVDLVLVPLLGTGLIQPVQCIGAVIGGTCNGGGGATPSTAFRVGVDGQSAPLPAAAATLPQPLFPGVNGIAAGAGEGLDPHFRPNFVDSFNLTVQRQLHRGVTMELGYIGRRIQHEYQPININAVPYMMTVGGQQFKNAYANVAVALNCAVSTNACGGNVPSPTITSGNTTSPNPAYGAFINGIKAQPFFENALNSSYCTGTFSNGTGTYANCTAAVVDNELGNITGQNVWSMWSDLDGGPFKFGRTMMNTALPGANGASGQLTSGVGMNASIGHGNYNGAFVSFKMSDWHGLTTQSNLTWSKTLSTGAVVQATSEETAVDPYNLNAGYGLAGFDRKLVYNLFFVYNPPFYKGQSGVVGHVLGGWTFAPIFTAGSGLPITLGTVNGGGQAFGEADSANFFANGNSENAVQVAPISTGVHKTAGQLPNLFADPAKAFDAFRQPILGLDTRNGGWGIIRGLPYWNMDVSLRKGFKITERFNFEFQMVTVNLFNHPVFQDPGPGDYLDTSAGPDGFGTLPAQGNTPRTMEFGLRLSF